MQPNLGALPAQLATPVGPHLVVTPGPISYHSTVVSSYVPPLFTMEHGSWNSGASVLLLSAPVATGKSTAAKFLAAATGAPILDLAQLQVGSGTLAGTITANFGVAAGAQFLLQMQQGQQLLLVDALDEAELRAGERNFQFFLHELEMYGRNNASSPTIVVLGRTETIEWVALTFDDDAVPYIRASIDFFDRDQAWEFLDLRLDELYAADKTQLTHRTHRDAYVAVRDLLLGRVYKLYEVSADLAWSDEGVRRFLGYVPVLEAFARYLKVPNHYALAQEMRASSVSATASDQWSLLRRVVEDLLVREQGKTSDQLWPQLQPLLQVPWNGSNIIYSPEEQCERLLARVDGSTPPALPLQLDVAARPYYEQRCSGAMLNHPFLAGPRAFVSVVFRDYVLASALSLRSVDATSAAMARRIISADDYLASPLLAGFLHALTQQASSTSEHEKIGQVAARDVGAVFDSVRSRGERGEKQIAVLVGGRGGGALILSTGSAGFAGQARRAWDQMTFTFVDAAQGVLLSARTAGLIVNFRGAVEFGTRGGSLVLGPDVHVACEDLLLMAGSVAVHGDESMGDVELQAESFLGLQDLSLIKYGSGSLRVWWPEMSYHWLQYRAEPPNFGDARLAATVHAELRRLITRFRDKRGSKVAVYRPLLDNLVVSQNMMAQAVLAALMEIGLVEEATDFYLLDLKALSAFGLNYVDLRANRDSPALRELVSQLVQVVERQPGGAKFKGDGPYWT